MTPSRWLGLFAFLDCSARRERIDALRPALANEQMDVYERGPLLGFEIPKIIGTPNDGNNGSGRGSARVIKDFICLC